MQYLVTIKVKPSTSQDQLAPLLKREAAKAWEMMASGVLRSAYYIRRPIGAVLMLEAGDEKEADSHVAALPLVEAGVVDVEILCLAPFTAFAALFSMSPA